MMWPSASISFSSSASSSTSFSSSHSDAGSSSSSTASSRGQKQRGCSLSRRCRAVVKQQKTRFYILGRCVSMLLCWHAHSISDN